MVGRKVGKMETEIHQYETPHSVEYHFYLFFPSIMAEVRSEVVQGFDSEGNYHDVIYDDLGFRYNLPEKGVAVSPFRYYYWMLVAMFNIFCYGTPIRKKPSVEKRRMVLCLKGRECTCDSEALSPRVDSRICLIWSPVPAFSNQEEI